MTEVRGRETRCVVRTGGTLGSHKNVNIIGVKSRLPAVTEKDVENLRFAVRQDMDFVAASFVRKPEDILEIRQLLVAEGSRMHIIAKIEDQEGVENIDGIIRVADGIMVARGDLGVQLATEEMPLVQKRIILKCHDQNKAVITATQMLDSMIYNPRPTRAEATDVANAIFDGSDAVMLSGETASGKYPVAAVQVMDSHRPHRGDLARVRIAGADDSSAWTTSGRTSRRRLPAARSSWRGRSGPRRSSPRPCAATRRG